MRVLCVVLLILSGASIVSALSHTPAFDPAARQLTILGDWRVATNAAMYDTGTYEFQRGYGFLAADALVSSDTEARDELATPEVAEDRARQAITALQKSVNLDPGNAHAWASLGWAHARVADDASAVAALRNSWRLASYNHVLAETRINLIGTLTTPGLVTIQLSDRDKEAIQRDAAALARFDREALLFHASALPHLADLAEIQTVTP